MATSVRLYDSPIFSGARLFPFMVLWESRRIIFPLSASKKCWAKKIKDLRLISASDGDAGYFPKSGVMREI